MRASWSGVWFRKGPPLAVSTIRSLREEGATIVLVEQMAAVALRLADRAYVLENGQIKLSGTGAELAHTPEVRRAYLGG